MSRVLAQLKKSNGKYLPKLVLTPWRRSTDDPKAAVDGASKIKTRSDWFLCFSRDQVGRAVLVWWSPLDLQTLDDGRPAGPQGILEGTLRQDQHQIQPRPGRRCRRPRVLNLHSKYNNMWSASDISVYLTYCLAVITYNPYD